MSNRLGFERRDGRNLLVVVAVVGAITAVLTSEPLAVRIAAGLVAGAVAGVSFAAVTVVINRFKPDHW